MTAAVTQSIPSCVHATGKATMLKSFRKIEPLLTVLIWPLMLQLTLRTFARFEVSYVLCLVGEFTLFGFFRIVGVALGVVRRNVSPSAYSGMNNHD